MALPRNAGPAREQAILDAVQAGDYDVPWASVTSSHEGHTATFFVFGDALKVEGCRVNVTAQTQQSIADTLDCMLLTPKLADLIWMQREVSLRPQIVRPFGIDTQAMETHSSMIDAQLAKLANPYGLISTVGKHWVVDNGLLPPRVIQGAPVAMNYGWHFSGPTFDGSGFEITASRVQDEAGRLVRLIQGKGTKHNMLHVDYSQTCVLVSLNCKIDGSDMRLDDVLRDGKLAPLANHDGVLQVLRQPGT